MADTPEHIERLESGGMVCRHCGGAVDDTGYSAGGEVAEAEETLSETDVDSDTAQMKATERLRPAFADAVSRRAR